MLNKLGDTKILKKDFKYKIMQTFLKNIKALFIIMAIIFAIPSYVYLFNNKTLLNFDGNLEYCFLLTNNINRLYQAIIYTIIITIIVIIYFMIIKFRKQIFKNVNQIFIFITIVSSIFVFVVPFWCSDVFYYLGIGRLAEEYHQNPYYTDMKSFIDNNEINMEKDTVMQKGYKNYWAKTTVVYGAVWTIICSIISFLSLGRLELGLLIFKIINLLIHIGNCYLLFKISKKKVFPILYGLNPFILIEGIANVHNDLFVIFFLLLSLYQLLNKKSIISCLLYLALATDIKYFTILFLPFIIIYYYKNQDIKTRIINCIKFGSLFILFVIIPYIVFFKDFRIFMGLLTQRERIAKGLYLFISEYFNNPPGLTEYIKTIALAIFTVIYFNTCVSLLFSKTIIFSKQMKIVYLFLLAFLFLLITNFQPWYFIWLSPLMIWQNSKNIKLIIQMQLLTLYANIVFLINTENFRYGVPFFMIFVFGILICIIKNNKNRTVYIRRNRFE